MTTLKDVALELLKEYEYAETRDLKSLEGDFMSVRVRPPVPYVSNVYKTEILDSRF